MASKRKVPFVDAFNDLYYSNEELAKYPDATPDPPEPFEPVLPDDEAPAAPKKGRKG